MTPVRRRLEWHHIEVDVMEALALFGRNRSFPDRLAGSLDLLHGVADLEQQPLPQHFEQVEARLAGGRFEVRAGACRGTARPLNRR